MIIKLTKRTITVDGYKLPRFETVDSLEEWMKKQGLAIHTLPERTLTRASTRGTRHRVRIGRTIYYDGYRYGIKMELCWSGMHWLRVLTNYRFRMNRILTLVEPVGKIIEKKDKGCSQGRKCLAIAPLELSEVSRIIFKHLGLLNFVSYFYLSNPNCFVFTYQARADFNTIITAYLLSLAKKEGTR